jgi:hypothetical protein
MHVKMPRSIGTHQCRHGRKLCIYVTNEGIQSHAIGVQEAVQK